MNTHEDQAAVARWLETHEVEKCPPRSAGSGLAYWYGGPNDPFANIRAAYLETFLGGSGGSWGHGERAQSNDPR